MYLNISARGVTLICRTADRGTCGTCRTAEPSEPIFLIIKLKKIIIIIKMSTSGLVFKNNRERKKKRKKRKIKREKANKKKAYNKGYFLSVTHPSSNPAGLGLTSAIGRRARFTRLRREVVNISQFPTVPNSVLQLGMLTSLMVSAISVIS